MKATILKSIFGSSIMTIEDDQEIQEITINDVEGKDEGENGLSYWDFINSSDFSSQDEDGCDRKGSVETLSLESLPSSLQSSILAPISVSPNVINLEDVVGFRYTDQERFYYNQADDCGDEEEDADDNDLDDELIPWHLTGKLGRNRMRKLGKKLSTRMIKGSKKNPFGSLKPGCVHGKHGLGVKVGY